MELAAPRMSNTENVQHMELEFPGILVPIELLVASKVSTRQLLKVAKELASKTISESASEPWTQGEPARFEENPPRIATQDLRQEGGWGWGSGRPKVNTAFDNSTAGLSRTRSEVLLMRDQARVPIQEQPCKFFRFQE